VRLESPCVRSESRGSRDRRAAGNPRCLGLGRSPTGSASMGGRGFWVLRRGRAGAGWEVRAPCWTAFATRSTVLSEFTVCYSLDCWHEGDAGGCVWTAWERAWSAGRSAMRRCMAPTCVRGKAGPCGWNLALQLIQGGCDRRAGLDAPSDDIDKRYFRLLR
jgi:hypothetical protein